MKNNKIMNVWYLYHSGFAVETENCFLVFDYWRDTPKGGLAAGVIDLGELAAKKKDVFVFASHNHPDHYNHAIASWPKKLPGLELVLSNDIPAQKGALMVGKNKYYTQDKLSLRTFESNDEGVAFLASVDGLQIFHSGDLNWWHWEGEPDSYNEDMANRYRKEIDKLRDYAVDLAFIPVDPRLEDQYAWAIDYLMRNVDVKHVVPMHFFNDDMAKRLLSDPVSAPYRDRIAILTQRGQKLTIQQGRSPSIR